ncbi:hypothetical protein JCM10450v2_000171 [Rhodotorula kratochvilovae]
MLLVAMVIPSNVPRLGTTTINTDLALFGPSSGHHVGLVVAQSYGHKSHKRIRSFETVKPLADELGLEVDVSCQKEDPPCVRRVVEAWKENGGEGEVVLAWKGTFLGQIAYELGVDAPGRLHSNFDVTWTIRNNTLISEETQDCPEIAPQAGLPLPDYDCDVQGNVAEGEGEGAGAEETGELDGPVEAHAAPLRFQASA